MRRATLLIVVALLLVGGLGTIVIRRGTTLLYELTFNVNEPWGTEEGVWGLPACTTHGATSTYLVQHRCEEQDEDPQEGDGVFWYSGAGFDVPFYTKWCNKFDGQTEMWVRFWNYVDEVPGENPNADILRFTNGAGCATIGSGSGYSLRLSLADLNWLLLFCDGVGQALYYTPQTWEEFLMRVNIEDGDIDLWVDDFTGAPDYTCNGAGGDTATPITGFLFQSTGWDQVDEQRMDHIRVYDSDPR